MVLSTKETADGVEIMAITPDALDQLSAGLGRSTVSAMPGGGSAELYSAPPRRSTAPSGPSFPHELVISDVIKSQRNLDGSPVYTPEQLGKGKRPEPAAAASSARASAARDSEIAASALAAASANAAEMSRLVLEMAQVKNLLQLDITDQQAVLCRHGNPFKAEAGQTLAAGASVRIYLAGRFIGVGQVDGTGKDQKIQPVRLVSTSNS
ncbi:MAG: hypothetical protein EBZ91_11845 [Gammaproteobacteria bacterium]|nr:hypothetical protein [Gammaproteobacteria bacterium]